MIMLALMNSTLSAFWGLSTCFHLSVNSCILLQLRKCYAAFIMNAQFCDVYASKDLFGNEESYCTGMDTLIFFEKK
jgi:hypothetical protein